VQPEVKIQEIDFLLRYPSYLCFELQKATQDKATIERKLARIYRIAIQTILNS
jgi:hypothetical protein